MVTVKRHMRKVKKKFVPVKRHTRKVKRKNYAAAVIVESSGNRPRFKILKESFEKSFKRGGLKVDESLVFDEKGNLVDFGSSIEQEVKGRVPRKRIVGPKVVTGGGRALLTEPAVTFIHDGEPVLVKPFGDEEFRLTKKSKERKV